jgi:hypothetical protein
MTAVAQLQARLSELAACSAAMDLDSRRSLVGVALGVAQPTQQFLSDLFDACVSSLAPSSSTVGVATWARAAHKAYLCSSSGVHVPFAHRKPRTELTVAIQAHSCGPSVQRLRCASYPAKVGQHAHMGTSSRLSTAEHLCLSILTHLPLLHVVQGPVCSNSSWTPSGCPCWA